MSIVRISRKRPYTAIPNIILESHELTFKARGLLCYLLSKPDNWETNTNRLAREAKKDGRDSILSAMKELQNAGFAKVVKTQNEKGHFATKWVIYDYPNEDEPERDYPTSENPTGAGLSGVGLSDFGLSDFGKPDALVNTELVNTELVNTEKKKPAVSGKTAFPPDFEITDSMRAWGRQHFKYVDLDRTTEQWIDACKAKDFRYKDWPSAWRNGIRNAVEWKRAIMMPITWEPEDDDG